MQGFYTVYGKVFKDLGAQEASAQEGVRNKPGHVAPGFGKGDSPWSEVSAFYQYWLYFVSDRSFTWADAYNPASAPNRKVHCAQSLPLKTFSPLCVHMCCICCALLAIYIIKAFMHILSCLSLQAYQNCLRHQLRTLPWVHTGPKAHGG